MNRLIVLLAAFFFLLPVAAQSIKKCQDADGKWFYGDHAASQCERSRITEIDEQGATIGETDAPPTQEELDAKQRAQEQMVEQAVVKANQRRLDQRLLITYDNPDSIVRTRDALLAAIDSAIEADQVLKEHLDAELDKIKASGEAGASDQAESLRSQIAAFDDAIQERLTQRELVRKKYDTDHRRYLELTQNSQ